MSFFLNRLSEISNMLNSGSKMIKGILVTFVVSEIIWQWHKRRSRKQMIPEGTTSNGHAMQLYNTETEIFEVMFFSNDSKFCRSHLASMKPCAKQNCAILNLKKIINYLDSATATLDICIYFFTFPELAEVIIKAKKRNVVVRMILDESMAANDTSQIMNFYKEGIKPKSKKLDSLVHHKFVIIDNNILITGSINWTRTAFFGNFENVLVTNKSVIVKPFINEFEKIWTMINAVITKYDSRN
ncbi:mitochondrial cardiolipin hydrolase [Solenopsis invicta]|uniref:mitochondrial cardiolipin hydrolase n=1 Tax=Solenopsis invicta TaxID=13686 RepID=UPI00193DF8FA|nr:mitochondrial cardiolipin hydrolase [Solenopsis invicta]